MQSDALDQLLSGYLETPVRLTWNGSVADSLMGQFDGVRVEMAGVATAWLPLDRVAVQSRTARFTPGLPARVRVEQPEVWITIAQKDLDRWLSGLQLPFHLQLGDRGLVVHTELAGMALSEFETRIEVVRGWFVLAPQRASVLGIPSQIARLFRAYLPIPPLSPEARLIGIDHEAGRITLRFGIDDFEEEVRPGLLGRLRRRVLPWAGQGASGP